jgi:23S rRNA (pseudouridine1915-N3)-methyltransferase
MKILILAVGHRMPDWVNAAWDEYAKRMPADWTVTLKEIKPESRTSGKTPQPMMAAESTRIEAAIPEHTLRIALDEHGKDLTTQAFATRLQTWHQSHPHITIIIGGPDGLDAELKASCDGLLRLSSMTMPHPMVRVVFIEQLYRAWSILNNHPYHRV